jgi:hypothetical protein
MIDIAYSYKHYRDHLVPIWDEFPEHVRGNDWGEATARGLNILMVAGYGDVKRHLGMKLIYVEHGAGQSYVGLDPAVQPYYSGGPQHRGVLVHVCPSWEVAERWHQRRPDGPLVVAGCPKLDPWHRGDRGAVEERTVAVTFHWDALWTGVPETSSAFPYYHQHLEAAILKWRSAGWHVIGHAHPRYSALQDFWRWRAREGLVEYVEDSAEVLDRAAVLVADNTSLQAEFLSLGRSVVWVNAPQYRRDVEHGGRFWSWPSRAGTSVDSPEELVDLDLSSVPRATWHPYAYVDGRASLRAAWSLREILAKDL